MKYNQKIYIGILIFLISFFLLMFFAFGINQLKKEKETASILISNDTIWTYRNQKWVNNSLLKNYEDLVFQVYLNNEKYGNYYVLLDNEDGWRCLDKNKNKVKMEGEFFAYYSSNDYSLKSINTNKVDNKKYIHQLLEENGLSRDSKFTSSSMTTFDIDQDGVEEKFYTFTNAFPIGFKVDKIFTFAYMIKDSKMYSIYSDVSNYQGYNGCKPYLSYFLDIDQDNRYEFIFNCGLYSKNTPIRRLYQFKDNEFKIVISNEL